MGVITKFLIVILGFSFLTFSQFVQAETIDDISIMSLRQRAMGGVSVTTSEDDHALHQNPASLMNIKKPRFKLFYFNYGGSPKGLKLFSEAFDIVINKKEPTESEALDMIKDFVPSELDFYLGLSPLFSYSWTGGGFGLYTLSDIRGSLGNKAQPTIKFTGGFNSIFALGFAKKAQYINKSFDVGITFKGILRQTLYDEETGTNTFVLNANDALSSSSEQSVSLNAYTLTGGAIDLGFKTNYENKSFKGSYGFTFKNVLSSLVGTKTITNNNAQSDEEQTHQLPLIGTFGFSIDDEIVGLGDVTLALDYRFISPETNYRKNLYMGAEKKLFNDILALRGGFHQGFVVGGIGIDLVTFHFDYVFFVEEFGEKIGHNSRVSQHFQFAFFY